MILADTSVWVAHFRHGEQRLTDSLLEGSILTHPWVCGELACGNLRKRESILSDLQALPSAMLASDAEVTSMIEEHKLWGRGLGWIDVHLLVSSLLSRCKLWTLDKRLERVARDFGLV
jgi:predicted nucleic acid-binding protein